MEEYHIRMNTDFHALDEKIWMPPGSPSVRKVKPKTTKEKRKNKLAKASKKRNRL